ncbi:hypothetical protein E5E91_03070 [Deinococcus radiodurans R1 = ATCC 13939 = DSM 20539]|uniref:Uncharacterized protein n=1 Tax=Deinococcus radiodurans (strain ATCC 13939 / DSM 20539 / JCM 16871 / CCUG 27074 / LMG 4051 / NBRC 15346 / NCIMB 9279 / VKM B-1422 / R1) TaxID=243230 RepID=Q9RWS6_DEIRA|nr:hypothetical protein DR_0589 [Deinococcus radiodurans R1 = ATCC 13939 = DSM 20539]QEM72536.1 hypothetical protein DXG80_12680 [Deinococcus radiodurans]UDK99769.1 hypothetical protein E5E91_03070 [Deinococcus radiodurans R1 = ATCC 13939 = DSM 20539]HCE64327.1 hypothetical protein [Deinococcus radiodurans]
MRFRQGWSGRPLTPCCARPSLRCSSSSPARGEGQKYALSLNALRLRRQLCVDPLGKGVQVGLAEAFEGVLTVHFDLTKAEAGRPGHILEFQFAVLDPRRADIAQRHRRVVVQRPLAQVQRAAHQAGQPAAAQLRPRLRHLLGRVVVGGLRQAHHDFARGQVKFGLALRGRDAFQHSLVVDVPSA